MSELIGKIKVIGEIETYGTFTKKGWVITTDEQYPQDVQLECHQDKTSLLDTYKVGDNVKASINIRGKEWINPEGVAKYFNTLVAWRIEKVLEVIEGTPVVDQPSGNEESDLPF